jgi:hypothetical protein
MKRDMRSDWDHSLVRRQEGMRFAEQNLIASRSLWFRLAVTLRTRDRALKQALLPLGSSIEIAEFDPRYGFLSRAYRIIVRKTKAQEP